MPGKYTKNRTANVKQNKEQIKHLMLQKFPSTFHLQWSRYFCACALALKKYTTLFFPPSSENSSGMSHCEKLQEAEEEDISKLVQ